MDNDVRGGSAWCRGGVAWGEGRLLFRKCLQRTFNEPFSAFSELSFGAR